MRHLDFISCPADPDVWMRPAKRSDGSEYYEYILLYIDDALVVSKNAEQVLRTELGCYWTLKEESIGPRKIYLGGHVRKVQLDNRVECWTFSSSQYMYKRQSRMFKNIWPNEKIQTGDCRRKQRRQCKHRTAQNWTYHQSCSQPMLHTICL